MKKILPTVGILVFLCALFFFGYRSLVDLDKTEAQVTEMIKKKTDMLDTVDQMLDESFPEK